MSDAQTMDLSGAALREGLGAATTWLARHAAAVDAINVFPVPDGDTGANMALTMRAALEEAARLGADPSPVEVLAAVARGALLGARGNSGVILSQWLRGLAEALADVDDHQRLAGGLHASLEGGLARAAEAARAAVTEPREGTILSVADALPGASAASMAAWAGAVAARARAAAERTPEQLPILREAGVIDAGGLGLALLLEGLAMQLRGEPLPPAPPAGAEELGSIDPEWLARAGDELAEESGFCTEFVVGGEAIDLEGLRAAAAGLGDSVLVVGDATLVHVHVHTREPEAAFALGADFGAVAEQKADDLSAQRAALRSREGLPAVAVVAVASGSGYVDLFRDLGVAAIVPGGQTMNPSAEAIVRAARATHSVDVLVLPNNGNIVPAAEQAAQLVGDEGPRIHVVPTRSQPAGVAAMTAVDPGAAAAANRTAMAETAEAIVSGAVTYAARAVSRPIALTPGQPFALLEGEVVAGAGSVAEALTELVGRMLAAAPAGELLTIYQGSEVEGSAGERTAQALRAALPARVEVELVIGGQPHYPWEVSLE